MDDAIDEIPGTNANNADGKHEIEKPQYNPTGIPGIVTEPNYQRGLEDLGRFFTASDRSARNQHRGVTWEHLTVQPIDELTDCRSRPQGLGLGRTKPLAVYFWLLSKNLEMSSRIASRRYGSCCMIFLDL
jgi:hypothetical protein